MTANGNPGECGLAGAKGADKKDRELLPASQKPEGQHRLVVRHGDGETEGAHPLEVPVADLNAAGHHPGPMLAIIREKCLDCSGGSPSEVRKCTCTGCALWPYRLGRSPFRAGRTATGRPFATKTPAKIP